MGSKVFKILDQWHVQVYILERVHFLSINKEMVVSALILNHNMKYIFTNTYILNFKQW